MGNILGSWSGMRKYLENEMLADSLKGRIRYGCTTYVGMDDSKIFEICVDGKQAKRFSWETVNSYFIDKGCKMPKEPYGQLEYWIGFHNLLNEYSLYERCEYTDAEFCEALNEYRNQDINASIKSKNPLIRMFAVLDRRIGKRTLLKIKEQINEQPEWLKHFYELRISAEDVN